MLEFVNKKIILKEDKLDSLLYKSRCDLQWFSTKTLQIIIKKWKRIFFKQSSMD